MDLTSSEHLSPVEARSGNMVESISVAEGASRKRSRERVACTRCRQLRKKCINEKAQSPCLGCRESGTKSSSDCRFPARGEPDLDRNYRRVRIPGAPSQSLAERTSEAPSSVQEWLSSSRADSRFGTDASLLQSSSDERLRTDRWHLLPPPNEVIDAYKIFYTSFFQLGFFPKAVFLEQLTNDRASINVFLLLSVLSVSARFTPSLIARYGDGLKAAELFMGRAAKLVPEEMYKPTLERIQAFFLLAIAEWGKGDKTASNIHMGIAVRMAGILRLHREDTYALPENSTAEDVINSEMARRTFWVLESQDNLHSGYTTPVSFSLGDITTLLPCEERDFSFGLVSHERAALAGTLAATRNPSAVHATSRSLFATLIQAHNLWGQVARGAIIVKDHPGDVVEPWKASSDYDRLATSLNKWEEHLPSRHEWSIWNFRGYKAEGLDLAYLSVVMVLRLSNIILRRSFMDDIIRNKQDDSAPSDFWGKMSTELFENVLALHEQIAAFSSLRSPEQGFPAIVVFCVYVCGSLANNLWERPEICPQLADGMEHIARKSLKILSDLQHPWQLARKWKSALEQRTMETAKPCRSMKHLPHHHQLSIPSLTGVSLEHIQSQQSREPSCSVSSTQFSSQQKNHEAIHAPSLDWIQRGPVLNQEYGLLHSHNDDIEAQLLAFLEVQGQLGVLYG